MMSDERLAEIRQHVRRFDYGENSDSDDMIHDLLAEVDHLRAELATLKSALLNNNWFLDCQECAVWRDVQRVQPGWIPESK